MIGGLFMATVCVPYKNTVSFETVFYDWLTIGRIIEIS